MLLRLVLLATICYHRRVIGQSSVNRQHNACAVDSSESEYAPLPGDESYSFSASVSSTDNTPKEGGGCMRDAYCDTETSTCICKDGFDGDGVICTPLATCQWPKRVHHGNWTRLGEDRETKEMYPGDRIKYSCKHGYAIKRNSGQKVRTCMSTGQWDLKKPVCVVAKCDAPQVNITNGNSTALAGTKYPRDHIILYSCFPGYRINGGSSELICISDDSLSGEWSDPTPTCEVIQCYDVGYPENANRIGNPPYFIGDEVKFRCMSGYDLIGSSFRTCQPNGKWSGYLTICDNGAGDCRNPGTPINGRKVGRRYMLGDVVTFKCNKGFAIIGTSERTCLNTGAWSGTQPTCRGPRDYDDPESIAQYFGKTLDKFHEDTAISSDGDSRGRTIDLSYGGRLEIYIAIDASGSIRKPNFDHAVEFAKALVRKTGVSGGRKGPWYAGLMYTNKIERDKYFHVTSTSKEDVLGEFDRFEYEEDGGTDTAAALNFVRTQMISFSKATFREEDERASSRIPPPKRVVFLLSDGASNSGGDPIKAAELLKDDGVEIYVIGVRLKKENDELLGIASTDLPGEHIFILADHNSLGRLADEITGKTKPDYSICGIAGDTQESSQRGRVSGGWEAIEGAWPWQAMLWKSQFDVNSNKYIPDGSLFCGGSIIDREWILTAAHCFPKYNNNILVGLGYTDRFDNKEYTKQVTVKQVIKHGDYDSSTLDNDIALLKLKEPIEFSVYIQPVCLPNITREDKLKPNDIMVSTGWGNTKVQEIDEGRSKPDNLQQIYSKVRKDKDCSDNVAGTIYSFTNNMFCIDGQGNTTCKGDSGGPISKKVLPNDERDEHWVQFGIVSFGIGCGLVGKYDYHTDVTRFMDWIEDKTSLDFS